MRKICILFCSVLLCVAVCFPAYADLVLPSIPDLTTPQSTVVMTEEDVSGNTTYPDTSTTAPATDNSRPSIAQRLHAIWAAIVAAALAVAAFFAQLFHKK